MKSYLEALALVEAQAARRTVARKPELLALPTALGRYAAQEVIAREPHPRFDNSAMDGFAVCAQATSSASENNPSILEVSGSVRAGEAPPPGSFGADCCVEIMTGAAMPGAPFDAVVRIEDVASVNSPKTGRSAIQLTRPISSGENVRAAGQDFPAGHVLVSPGSQIGPPHILALATDGHSDILAATRPRAVILSTGDELVDYHCQDLNPQQIRNSTAPFLATLLTVFGCEVRVHGIVPDDAASTRKALETCIEESPELIVTTGGVSAGKYDLVRPILEALGAEIVFHKAAVRPGKPVLFASLPGKRSVVFGLPGNPISVGVSARFFVKPYLRALFGEAREAPHRLTLMESSRKPDGFTFFQRGIRVEGGVKVLPGQASFMLDSMLSAQGWVVAEPEGTEVLKGSLVDWYPLW